MTDKYDLQIFSNSLQENICPFCLTELAQSTSEVDLVFNYSTELFCTTCDRNIGAVYQTFSSCDYPLYIFFTLDKYVIYLSTILMGFGLKKDIYYCDGWVEKPNNIGDLTNQEILSIIETFFTFQH